MLGGYFLRFVLALLGLCSLILVSTAAVAETAFRVSDIRVEGLQRLPVERVFRHLAIQKGDIADADRLADAVRGLYGGGDFEDVQLGRDNDVLVVIVRERPSIAKIDISGNKSIDTEELMKGLKNAGMTVGEVFRRSTLAGITGELERQHVAQGRYGATIESETVPLPRNRIGLKIKIYEGKPARIRDINVVGNNAFTRSEEHTSELQSRPHLVCRLLLEK